ncbi:MAG: radical SAM protein [Desulfovibrio sp.]|jgi:histone acetyltransferase (RNA polymerase elongator complex component)|nr:radical SAM protein [Desulfovibrio sp.]
MRNDIFPKTRFFSFAPLRGKGPAVYPIFLPFSGCPRRCLFCAQDLQTGYAAAPVRRHLGEAEGILEERLRRDLPALELAFFGGTFTALPPEDLRDCLDFAAYWRRQGAISGFRCSTRPDCLDHAVLADLKNAGCAMVEVGVQSFSERALRLCRRGYTSAQAETGCLLIKESGLPLGIQLMPGMPGLTPDAAQRDIASAISLEPACVRLYPCLVFAGSALAGLWQSGLYVPWDLYDCVAFLAKACLRFEHAGIAVARMGVAEGPGLREHVLAGPRHPSLGNMVRALALYHCLREKIREFKGRFPETPMRLFAPRRFQGEFWGYRKNLVPAYASLGLSRERVSWWERERFAITAL